MEFVCTFAKSHTVNKREIRQHRSSDQDLLVGFKSAVVSMITRRNVDLGSDPIQGRIFDFALIALNTAWFKVFLIN